MPGYQRAEVTAELKVVTSPQAERSPREQVEAATRAAAESGLAHEGGPETTVLAGRRSEVLEAAMAAAGAALEAGAHAVQVRVEAEGDARRFRREG